MVDNSDSSLSPSHLAAHWRSAVPVIAPSLLFCDFGHLADEVRRLEQAGAGSLHLDVMDGHFVPNLTYGLPLVETVRRLTKLPIDCHLMISNPDQFAEQYCDAGANLVTVHFEAQPNIARVLEAIRRKGCLAGLAHNPQTSLEAIEGCLESCDLVLTMSVHPGFGGQKFEEVALEKLRRLRQMVRPEVLLAVDGGVNTSTAGRCAAAGAQIFVAGSAIFGHGSDYSARVAALAAAANSQLGRTQEDVWSKSY